MLGPRRLVTPDRRARPADVRPGSRAAGTGWRQVGVPVGGAADRGARGSRTGSWEPGGGPILEITLGAARWSRRIAAWMALRRRTPRRGGRDRAPDPRGVAATRRRVRAHPRRGRRPRLSGDRRRPRGANACSAPRGPICAPASAAIEGRALRAGDRLEVGPMTGRPARWSGTPSEWPDPDRGRPAPGGDR